MHKELRKDRNIIVTLKGRLTMIRKTEEELQKELQIFKTFSNDANMDFGLDKRPNIVLRKGCFLLLQNIILEFYRQLQQFEQKKIWNYLVTERSDVVEH
jgi:hypothetical protein